MTILKSSQIETKVGPMYAVADEDALYFLGFIGQKRYERDLKHLKLKMNATIVPGKALPLKSIEKELSSYFSGKLTNFNTPIAYFGTPFQRQVWHALQQIPYGETCSYLDVAKRIEHPRAFRAVALANGNNQFVIMVPCHRVINHNGDLGGYGGGLERKQHLLALEKKYKS